MRSARWLVLILAPVLGACEDTPPPGRDLSSPPDLTNVVTDLAMTDNDGAVSLEFADFVVDLILNHTNDNERPVTTEDKTFVDSMDPTKFAVLF
jgi:hypothetical protein